MKNYIAGKYFWFPWGKCYKRKFLIENKIDFPQMRFAEDMVFCFKCLCFAKNYLRVPHVVIIKRVLEGSASHNYDLQTWFIVVTKVLNIMDEFMSQQKFFCRNADTRRVILQFIIDKLFNGVLALSEALPHVVYKFFYDALQSNEIDSRGKNILTAYLCTERVLTR